MSTHLTLGHDDWTPSPEDTHALTQAFIDADVSKEAAREEDVLIRGLKLPPHLERVHAELKELNEKLTKLSAFLGKTHTEPPDPLDMLLLEYQSSLMKNYADVLTFRLRVFVKRSVEDKI